jgi:ankyrin repeat protein
MYYCSNGNPTHYEHSKEYALILQRLINARDKDGKTLMHAAAASGDLNLCRRLQDKGSDVNAQDKDGKAPLHDAMELVGRRDIFSNVNLSTIGDLIRIGANFDARDK